MFGKVFVSFFLTVVIAEELVLEKPSSLSAAELVKVGNALVGQEIVETLVVVEQTKQIENEAELVEVKVPYVVNATWTDTKKAVKDEDEEKDQAAEAAEAAETVEAAKTAA